MYKLSTRTMISAAHVLRDYDGPCARLHGHNWTVKVDVLAEQLNKVGLAIDFKDIDLIVQKVVGRFDHQNFNEIAPFDKINPTAENIARYFYHEIKTHLPAAIRLDKVSIWETENYLVEYFE